jgi:hypothetical protein
VTRPRLAGGRSAGATSRRLAGPNGVQISAPLPCVHGALRLQRGAEHLRRLGSRAVAEFLAEIGRRYGCEEAILDQLAEWRERLTPANIRAAGADRFAPALSPLEGGR